MLHKTICRLFDIETKFKNRWYQRGKNKKNCNGLGTPNYRKWGRWRKYNVRKIFDMCPQGSRSKGIVMCIDYTEYIWGPFPDNSLMHSNKTDDRTVALTMYVFFITH